MREKQYCNYANQIKKAWKKEVCTYQISVFHLSVCGIFL